MKTIKDFAKLLLREQLENFGKKYSTDPGNEDDYEVSIRPGKKYTKVDVGSSGKFMVDAKGNIFGIKGYGVVNKKKHYGTLQTIDQYYWGEYVPHGKRLIL